MNYITKVTIDLPRARVIELINDTKNLKKWQEGLISTEQIGGKPGAKGAKMRMKYKMGRREMEMIETITVSNFPEEFTASYETKGVFNLNKNTFKKKGENKTVWIMESDFQFSGFMKLFGFFMKGSFPKESLKQMNKFKEFAESE